MDSISSILIILAAALVFGEIARKVKSPRVIGHVVAGIVLGLALFRGAFDASSLTLIDALSNLGIVFLLLLTGLEIDLQKLRKVSVEAGFIAAAAAIMPFLFGFIVGKLFGYSDITSLILGSTLSITSEGTKVVVLMELKALRTRVGEIMVAAAVADDIFEVLFLSLTVALAQQGSFAGLTQFPLQLGAFILACFLFFKFVPHLMQYFEKQHSEVVLFTLTIFVSMGIAFLSSVLGFGPVIGAFVAGILVQLSFKQHPKEEKLLIENFKVVTLGFVVLFFFFNTGLMFSAENLVANVPLTLAILFAAVAGKILGTMAVKPWTNLSWKQSALVGVAMNSRGAIELVIAGVALANKLIPPEVFSAIVVMTIVTTLAFPFVLSREIKANPRIMR